MSVFSQILTFVGSLCLLLFGMNMLSNGIQKGAGSGLQKLLATITRNRFKAVLTGLGITAIIQSSGATTVMVISFVNFNSSTGNRCNFWRKHRNNSYRLDCFNFRLQFFNRSGCNSTFRIRIHFKIIQKI